MRLPLKALAMSLSKVFLAACIMDLFPDVKESMDHLLDEIENQYHVPVDYPLAEFVILVGFFLILIVENMVAECQVNFNS